MFEKDIFENEVKESFLLELLFSIISLSIPNDKYKSFWLLFFSSFSNSKNFGVGTSSKKLIFDNYVLCFVEILE